METVTVAELNLWFGNERIRNHVGVMFGCAHTVDNVGICYFALGIRICFCQNSILSLKGKIKGELHWISILGETVSTI